MATITTEHEQSLRDLVRSIHDGLDLPDGFRAEIVGGDITVAASPFGIHAYIVSRIRQAVDQALGPEVIVFENTTLEEPEIDRYIPDLAAWPVALMRDAVDEWIFPASECAFAVEVTSPKQEARDYTKAEGYSRGGVPVFLLVNRKTRKCIVYTDPTPKGYEAQCIVPFGTPVILTFTGKDGEPSTATIDTSDF